MQPHIRKQKILPTAANLATSGTGCKLKMQKGVMTLSRSDKTNTKTITAP